ncbi:PAS domain-containing protein [Chryseolinea lacunae]|uniref:histidine kinase n=1 Tax=Chryseolinea lacunae TaxID=2801331 RepID=A0ABS1KM01_9BACT|nr:PAS domain-containing protein [Chryseolinea lacunae]MBL0740490.1 PAS domain-containing protein [Chryseolinea lacunae]
MNTSIFPPPDFRSKLIQQLPGVYYMVQYTDHWEVISATEQTSELLGFTPREIYIMSCNFFERVIHPEDFTMVSERKQNSFEEGKLFVLEYRIYDKFKSLKYVRDQYTCFKSSDGTWLMEGYLSEIAQTGIRDRLIQQLRAYRDAVDVNMISSITDTKGKIVYANENFCRISKYTMWELVGKNHRIVNSGHHSSEFFADLWNTISDGKLWQGEILNKAKDGTLYWVDTVIIPIFDESRKIVNYLSLRMPIDDRKDAEAHRKNYVHLLEKIAFIVAHEVRGPLCSILGLVNLLVLPDNTPEQTAMAIGYLKGSADQLNAITQKLSRFVWENEIELKVNAYKE